MDIIYHYPPELTQLLIDAIPLLCRGKKDVILFFKGSGYDSEIAQNFLQRINRKDDTVNKYLMTREIIADINEKGESALRIRRELLKRVTEYEDYSTCWPADQLKAKGLVAEIRRVINVKDSFTRMQNEAEKERLAKRKSVLEEVEKKRLFKDKLAKIKTSLYALFSVENPQKRGKMLESILNDLFNAYGILLREAFAQYVDDVHGATDQVDGVIEFQNSTYLVEMKWTRDNVDKGLISEHLVRVYHRGYTRGIFISCSSYTEPAIVISKEALQHTVFVLFTLDEIVFMLEQERDLLILLKEKIDAAMINKIPYKRITS